jgi:hypothetical protein
MRMTRTFATQAHCAISGWAISSAVVAMLIWLLPDVAHACPMCFGGNNQNQNAFLYGSLFLMIVPVVSIGSLLYWAYRRTRALEDPPPPAKAPHVSTGIPLRVVGPTLKR